MTLTASEVWRDYNIDGVPASGASAPSKRDIRSWASLFETLGTGGGPGLGYATKSLMDADQDHAAATLAVVYNDSTASNNGLYVKSPGVWTRVADLPNGIIRLTVTGGTANAIVATAPETPSLPGAKLYLLTPAAQNTAATTIAVNGTAAVSIKNAFGSSLASGSLLEDSQVLMAWSVDHYQLLISANVDANAILADAQAADVSANAAADAAHADAILAANAATPQFTTKSEAVAFTPTTAPDFIRFLSQSGLVDDNGGEEWLGKKVTSAPAHENYITIGDGSIYSRVPAAPRTPANIAELGCNNAGDTFDNTPFFNKILAACENSNFRDWYVPPGAFYFNSRPDDLPIGGITLRGTQNQRGTLYKNFESDGTADAIINVRDGQGFLISDLALISLAGSQNPSNIGTGSLLSIKSDTTHTAGYVYIERCIFTGDASLTGQASSYSPVYVEGYLKDSSPFATRTNHMRDCQIFGGEICAIWINGAVHFYWVSGGTYLAGGKTGKIFITNDSGTFQNEQIHLSLGEVSGGILITNSNSVRIDSTKFSGNIDVGVECNDILLIGPCSGVVTGANAGTNRHIDWRKFQEATISGSANVATTGTVVSFGKTFATAPRVTATVVGANATAYLDAVPSTTGCTLKTSTGTQLVHWQATGQIAS